MNSATKTPLPGSFDYIERQIRTTTISPQEAGRAFEHLCREFLLTAPQYKERLKRVWLWKDWPGCKTIDKGIDLVAETMEGMLWAIQSKFFDPDRAIPKAELDSFLSESNRPEFSFRLVIATTDDIGRNARDTIEAQEKPVGLVLRGELLQSEIQWPRAIKQSPKPLPKKSPRTHQKRAITKVCSGFHRWDRGRLTMACGTGKTLTALWIAEALRSQRVLVLVPSLSLVAQTLKEWSRNSARPFDYLVVCSDETVAHHGEDHAVGSTRDLGVPVTTSIATIRRFLLNRRHVKPQVVFCTYQSSDCIAEAQKGAAPIFDLALADEAHRCTGHADSLFTTILDGRKIRAKKRLFMTATPRYFTGRIKKVAADLEYELASMDNQKLFGPEFHQLTFGAAIRQNLLSDYRVVVIGVTSAEIKKVAEEGRLMRVKGHMQTDARTLAAQIGLTKAMRKYDLRKIVTFHSSIEKARRFSDATSQDSIQGAINRISPREKPSGKLWLEHISGKTPTGRRSTLLNIFGNLDNNTRGLLSNCACLGEGVNVPSLDCVAFIDPKRSMIEIIQAVGRAIRKAADKHIGTVVVPVFVEESKDADQVLSQSAFESVWRVLKALRAHDTELAEKLDDLRIKLGRRGLSSGKIHLPPKIRLDIPTQIPKDFEQSFYVRTVKKTTTKPPLTEEQILAWADAHHERMGRWPNQKTGPVHEAPHETWKDIGLALHQGFRGFPGGSSLAKLLSKHRGVRNQGDLPPISIDRILEWADAHHKNTKAWPSKDSGPVRNAPGEKWSAVNASLSLGGRSLPGGSSLAKLLAKHRGVRNRKGLLRFKVANILELLELHSISTRK